jgi:hypothetical protein
MARHNSSLHESQIYLAHRNPKKPIEELQTMFRAKSWYATSAAPARQAAVLCDKAAEFARELAGIKDNPEPKDD